jgi:hypothetical protein
MDLGCSATEVAPSSPPYRALPAEAVEEATAVPFLPSLQHCCRSRSRWARLGRRLGTARPGREHGGEGETLDLPALSLSDVDSLGRGQSCLIFGVARGLD